MTNKKNEPFLILETLTPKEALEKQEFEFGTETVKVNEQYIVELEYKKNTSGYKRTEITVINNKNNERLQVSLWLDFVESSDVVEWLKDNRYICNQ